MTSIIHLNFHDTSSRIKSTQCSSRQVVASMTQNDIAVKLYKMQPASRVSCPDNFRNNPLFRLINPGVISNNKIPWREVSTFGICSKDIGKEKTNEHLAFLVHREEIE